MELLVCVIDDPGRVDDILQAFVEIGISGATVIDSYGMGKLLVQELPLFAGFRHLLTGTSQYNKTIFSVVESKEKLAEAVAAVEKICGTLDKPATGIMFTLPVNFVRGLRPEA